jgi:NitT/TauT family transport system ATP-binding protein
MPTTANPPTGLHLVRNEGVPDPSPPTAKGIHIAGVGMQFGSGSREILALSDVTLDVPVGQFLCIVGPSGCGKTTLLRILAGLDAATSGHVEFNVDAGARPLRSMVFQEQGIFPWMTVIENAAYALRARHVPKAAARALAREYLGKLGLARFAEFYPRELSGGMRQRVNLARAFANDSAVLLMDEPLASLDEQTKMLVQRDLMRLWDRTGKTVVYITHSLEEAVTLGDRVVVMTQRPGRVKSVIDIDLPRPRDVFEIANTEEFLRHRRRCWDALRDEVITSSHAEGA